VSIPGIYEFILLGLASWSVFHLLAHDDILDRPRRYVLRLDPNWEKDGDPEGDDYRIEWGIFLTCPYCAGFWIWVAWIVAWWIWPDGVLPIAVLVGGRAMVVGFQKLLGKDEDKDSSSDAKEIGDAIRVLARKQAVRSGS
jgi:hypothetical protein